jgi:hypothetical protein
MRMLTEKDATATTAYAMPYVGLSRIRQRMLCHTYAYADLMGRGDEACDCDDKSAERLFVDMKLSLQGDTWTFTHIELLVLILNTYF